MWLENLLELKKKSGMSSRHIAEITKLPEKTVVRIFSGETPNPYVDTLYRIVSVLGGSLDELLSDTKAVVGGHDLAALQTDVDRLKAENGVLTAENSVLKDKIGVLTAENDLLKMKLAHKEEIIALHNYYKTVMSGLAK